MNKEKDYWENRYARRGTSGAGSIGSERTWKWNIISRYLPKPNHIIDVGCGDLQFWEGRDCRDYVGIDISEEIIMRDIRAKPDWTFYNTPAQVLIKGLCRNNVFCLDLLFHIMTEEAFVQILLNLCSYSADLIFIHNWSRNPFEGTNPTDGLYQYFRLLDNYQSIFDNEGFKLIDKKLNPLNQIGVMYVLKRMHF